MNDKAEALINSIIASAESAGKWGASRKKLAAQFEADDREAVEIDKARLLALFAKERDKHGTPQG